MVTDAVRPAPVALVVLAGPQASGKSTLAAALGDRLRRRGESVAVVELDQVAAMALPTLPGWDVAHEVFEVVTATWLGSGVSCVVAEGSGSADEVARLRARAPSEAVVLVVATTTDLEVAFDRARSDPTRGVSRERDFLAGVYGRWPAELDRLGADVVVRTDRTTAADGAAQVVEALGRLRAQAQDPAQDPAQGQASSTRSA